MEIDVPIVQITPKVQYSPWGGETFIPSLLGVEPDGRPWAELWFGTHSGGESTMPDGILLGDFLRDHARQFLGDSLMRRFGNELPFLVKILSIARPFSLQVHPSSTQAQRGFSDEVALHVDTDRKLWSFKDDRRKTEIFHAITPVVALCGFRSIDVIREHLERVVPKQSILLFPFLHEQTGESEDGLIQRFFTTLYSLETIQLRSLIEELSWHVMDCGEDESPESIARQLLGSYPEDPSVFAPFFLNLVRLAPGETLHVEPRTLHTYLRGNGLELMTNSDNVLRAGLTNKKVDVPEVIRAVAYRVQEPDICPQVRDSAHRAYVLAPADEFLLGVFDQGLCLVEHRHAIEFLLCTDGSAHLTCEEVEVTLTKGMCLVIGAALEKYQVKVDGSLFSISVPD